jgi:type IV pilus assembly protein PilA
VRPAEGRSIPSINRKPAASDGFSLVEVLVVILIIGILAAIAIPAFVGQRDRASDAEAKTGARNVATVMETYSSDDQSYAGADVALLTAIEPSLGDLGARLQVDYAQKKIYEITVKSKRHSWAVRFHFTRNADGTTERTCEVMGQRDGGCSNGKW